MSEEIRRPGVYGVNPAPKGSFAPPPAPPVPPVPTAPTPTATAAPAVDRVQTPKDAPLPAAGQQMVEVLVANGTPIDEARKRVVEWMNLTPAERWLRAIKDAKLTEEEALEIQDKMLSQGFWEKDITLYRGKLKLKLRTRDSSSNQRVADAIDSCRSNDGRVHYQVTQRVQLAMSLVQYNDQALPVAGLDQPPAQHNDAFVQRLAFCDRLPGAIQDLLFQVLSDFDRQVYAAMSEGASSGF
jgi:hypothetical protein